jgi:hypothetical protein
MRTKTGTVTLNTLLRENEGNFEIRLPRLNMKIYDCSDSRSRYDMKNSTFQKSIHKVLDDNIKMSDNSEEDQV